MELNMPVWFDKAKTLINTAEIPGAKSNSKILGWAAAIGGWVKSFYTNDDIPWCGLFVAYCLNSTIVTKMPKNPLGARNWGWWGKKLTKPAMGAIMVFSRSGGGHVGFYAGESRNSYLILGGNQSNKVCYSWVAKNRLLDIRWPLEVEVSPADNHIRLYDESGRLSTNEA